MITAPRVKGLPGEDRNVSRTKAIVRDWNRDEDTTLEDMAEKWRLPESVIGNMLSVERLRGNTVR